MTDFEQELLTQLRELRIQLGALSGQVNKNEGTLQALVKQVEQVEVKVDALPQVKPSGGALRDGGLTLSGGAVGAIIAAFVQHWTK